MEIVPEPTQQVNHLADDDINARCGHDKSYVAIIISVIPLWAILTTLIVFALLLFHKFVKLIKIYDNCTRQNANYVYHVEIRTGDTSATYNRRKTTITIDMFDENQTTLARIAIPGHVIFGRKEDPIPFLEDDKFFELRITRLWLYRSTKLRKVCTIRLTHSCMEPEARIMIYGVELRQDEPDRHKLFFPVMNYIAPYGAANKINTCYDFDLYGSITAMGGKFEAPVISEQLSMVDYTVLVYLYCALLFFMSTFDMLGESFKDSTRSILKGAIIGTACFVITGLVAVFMRYFIKYKYSIHVGAGLYSYVYHGFNALILIISTIFWIYTTIKAYNELCSNDYSVWVLCLCVAAVEGFAFAILASLIFWLINSSNQTPTSSQFVVPDDTPGSTTPSTTQEHENGQQQQVPAIRTIDSPLKSRPASSRQPANNNATINTSPSALMMPALAGPSNITGMPSWHPGTNTGPPPGIQPLPMMSPQPHGYAPYPVYMQQQPPQTGFKGAGFPMGAPPYDTTGYNQPAVGGIARPQSYHTQVTAVTTTASGRTKQTRKTGSNESTGSTYYQQLMKNKGGVKSISQYGELMKQKKNKR